MQIKSEEGILLPHSSDLHFEIEVADPINNIYKLKSKTTGFMVNVSKKQLDKILKESKAIEASENKTKKSEESKKPEVKEVKLSEFQLKVKEQMDKGLDLKAISEILGKPENTIKTSIEAINKKVNNETA